MPLPEMPSAWTKRCTCSRPSITQAGEPTRKQKKKMEASFFLLWLHVGYTHTCTHAHTLLPHMPDTSVHIEATPRSVILISLLFFLSLPSLPLLLPPPPLFFSQMCIEFRYVAQVSFRLVTLLSLVPKQRDYRCVSMHDLIYYFPIMLEEQYFPNVLSQDNFVSAHQERLWNVKM